MWKTLDVSIRLPYTHIHRVYTLLNIQMHVTHMYTKKCLDLNYENKVLNFVFKIKINSMYHKFAHKAVVEGMCGVYHTVVCTCNLHGQRS